MKIPGNVYPLLPIPNLLGIDVIEFSDGDLPQAISSVKLLNVSTDIQQSYLIVGSAIEISTEDEPKQGWLRIYEILDSSSRRKLNLITQVKVPGSVYCIDECDGKLICGIGNTVSIYKRVD